MPRFPELAAVVTTFPTRAVAVGSPMPFRLTLELMGEWWSAPAEALAPNIVRERPWMGSPWAYATAGIWGHPAPGRFR